MPIPERRCASTSVSAGLTPSRGAKLDIPLQFHVACVLLSERVMTPALILRDLERLLAGMSPRTRRPIRFLEPDDGRAGAPSDVLETGARADRRGNSSAPGASSAPGSSRPDSGPSPGGG